MSADQRGLLDAIYAAPDDDTPRRVYADWLMERDLAYGRFIDAQLRGDVVQAQASVQAACLASELAPPLARLSSFERGFLVEWFSTGQEASTRPRTGAWRLVKRLGLTEAGATRFLLDTAAQLVSLEEVRLEGEVTDAVEALAHVRTRARPLGSLLLGTLEHWFDFSALYDGATRLDFTVAGVIDVRRDEHGVHLSAPRRLRFSAQTLDAVLRAVVRPSDDVTFTFNMGRRALVEDVARALQHIPHGEFHERELLVIG